MWKYNPITGQLDFTQGYGDGGVVSKIYFIEITTPTTPSVGKVLLYSKPDGFMYSLNDAGVETKLSNSPDTGITDLSGDVSASGPGFAVATVNSVGGQSAAAVASSVTGLTLKVDKAFTPTTPADWQVVPTQVQQALDYLASGQSFQIDGGWPDSVYGGTTNINGGTP